MKQKKTFTATAPVKIGTAPPMSEEASGLVIDLPESPILRRVIDLTPWLGRGIDSWVWACAGQLRAVLASKEVSTATVAGYWLNGMRFFFEFLEVTGGPSEPKLLEPKDVRNYIGWLQDQGWGYGSQKIRYQGAKSCLRTLIRRGIVRNHPDFFPSNPFPGSNSTAKGAQALSPTERQRLALALRDDIVAIHNGRFDEPNSVAMVVYLLAVAIRTGANTTPLLEATRDCLRPHPFMPNMMLMALFKRRGNATKLLNLRNSQELDDPLAIPMDGVAIIHKALQLSDALLAQAAPEHRHRLWLFQNEVDPSAKEVAVLTARSLNQSISVLVKRHKLHSDDGTPLKLNLSRLRKTLEQRLWALSGGDLIATAALMGHNPRVADTHYLACTSQMRENATFVGEALPDVYRSGGDAKKVIPILPGKSPTGRCKDPYHGDKAPKNGAPCDDFFSCFTCTSYAIVGTPDDLHRLFSFYWFLEREMNQARSEVWRAEFRHTMNLIDRFTQDKFEADMVGAAKRRAQIEPLKFWASYNLADLEAANG